MNRKDAKYFEPPRRQDAKNDLCRQQLWRSVHGRAFTPLDAGSLKTLKRNFLASWRLGGSTKAFLGAHGVLAVQNDNEYLLQ